MVIGVLFFFSFLYVLRMFVLVMLVVETTALIGLMVIMV